MSYITVVGLGESLFDCFDDRQILGGAPLNFAACAHQLLAPVGGRAVVVTRAGVDDLGRRMIAELRDRGMTTDWVQRDDHRPTGRGLVTIEQGEPRFEIVADVAWDQLQFTAHDAQLAATCNAVCFGTLGQRTQPARASIQAFAERGTQAFRLFDVNLRQQYFSRETVERGCQLANVVKLNQHEMPVIGALLGLPAEGDSAAQARRLRERLQLDAVVLTRGAEGTVVFTAKETVSGSPVSYPRTAQADSVGAGDACAAGIVVGWLVSRSWQASVELANHAGAFVASMPGATPRLPQSILDRVVAASR